jgi:hypothetical protein
MRDRRPVILVLRYCNEVVYDTVYQSHLLVRQPKQPQSVYQHKRRATVLVGWDKVVGKHIQATVSPRRAHCGSHNHLMYSS